MSAETLAPAAAEEPAGPILGVGAPFAIAAVFIALGAVGLVWSMAKFPEFFRRRPTVVSEAELAAGHIEL